MLPDADVMKMIIDERRRTADLVESLDSEQLNAGSLCDAWSVKEVIGHLVAAVATPNSSAVLLLVRSGFRIHRANARLAVMMAGRPADELAELLRAHADDPFRPPIVGYPGQLTDLQVHGQDIRRPLGLPHDLQPERLRVSLDFLVGGRAVGFVPKRRPAGLRFEATDMDWAWGDGPRILGTAEAVMLALTGRHAALADLSGDGVAELTNRTARSIGTS
ncbi:maleylpyruvate isomerase family mycothiol-dependent enzyme [Actinoplanes sp. NPDC026670]|uniref:maleylpyruvate isomerase family mycothiol-dependent enzyme n=1 Tax=Actinoplanes sp. NPDC026670 TaxID=3154700 RepID=UPI00340F8BD2